MGAERVRERWGFLGLCDYGRDDTIGIFQYLVVPEPNDPIPMQAHLLRSKRVSLDIQRMLTAVDLDRELACGNREVRDVDTDRMLAPNLEGQVRLAQGSPEPRFGVR